MTTYNPGEHTQDGVTLSHRRKCWNSLKKKVKVLKRRKSQINLSTEHTMQGCIRDLEKWENIKGLKR